MDISFASITQFPESHQKECLPQFTYYHLMSAQKSTCVHLGKFHRSAESNKKVVHVVEP